MNFKKHSGRKQKYKKLFAVSALLCLFFLGFALKSPAQIIPFAFWEAQTHSFKWAGGPQYQSKDSSYGTQGVAATWSIPGERQQATSLIDGSGNFWLFGGDAFDGNGDYGDANDLWTYSPTSGLWTWMAGDGGATWGTKGTGSTNNYPGVRAQSVSWIDSSGNFWFFGGVGSDSGGNYGYMNDLWKNVPGTGTWTWMSGVSTANGNGTYGTKGTGATTNTPSARAAPATWIDSSGNLWLYGGYGLGSSGTSTGNLNDLWEYTPSSKKWTYISGAKTLNSAGTFGTKGTGSTSNTPSARVSASSWYDGTNLWLFGGNGVDSASNSGYLNDVWKFTPSSSTWTWMSGSSTNGVIGTYGTEGSGSTANTPGARDGSVSFKDSSGNFWLYGGQGFDSTGTNGALGDLWEFNSSTLSWTWISGPNLANKNGTYGTLGTAATSNIPGARSVATGAIDASGNFWLFGGYGYDSQGPNETDLDDLWKYNLSSGEWTWMSGSATDSQMATFGTMGTASASSWPSGRAYQQYCTDSSGNLWLFGGYGIDATNFQWILSDLWKFNPITGQWAWMGGSTLMGQSGVYGTLGTGSTSNIPGARSSGAAVADTSGNLWFFGGSGMDSVGSSGNLNDLWKYNTANGQWTWMGGSNLQGGGATYGTEGTASSSNIPGSRSTLGYWIDSSNNIWLFGGIGTDSAGNVGNLNDLWKYSTTTGQWTWMSGSNINGKNGTYGTKGVGSTSNIPGARQVAATWIDSSGNLWLFGGYGNDSAGNVDIMNDLWEYSPSNGQWTWVSGSNTVQQTGTYGTMGTASAANVPGARNANSAAFWKDSYGNFWMFSGFGLDINSYEGPVNELWKYSPSTGQWTWMNGSSSGGAFGVYGTLGMPNTSNVPGARTYSNAWVDRGGNAWIFGGDAYDSLGVFGPMNDLWEY